MKTLSIQEYLSSLGNTSEEVAESLCKQGIKGLVKSLRCCPIANALYASCDMWGGLFLGKNGDSFSATFNDAEVPDPQLPEAVISFIRDFDAGKYPDLEAKKVVETVTRIWE